MVKPIDWEQLKAENEAIARQEFQGQQTVLTARPLFLQIETTNRCNFNCKICERSHHPPKPHMIDMDIVDMLEENLFPYLRDSSLQSFGEPLTDPNFDALLERMTAHRIHAGFTTNGSLMTEERLEGYVRAGVFLCLSLDGATAETYNRIRPNGNFEAIVARFAQVPRLRSLYPDSGFKLRIHFVATTQNIDDLPAMLEVGERIGADEIEALNLLTLRLPATVAHWSLEHDPLRANQRFREAQEKALTSTVTLKLPPYYDEPDTPPVDLSEARNYILWPKLTDSPSPYPNSCSDPWTLAVISANGDVRPCCVWPYSMGNLHRQSFEEIWNGPGWQKIRRRVNSRFPQRPCKECTLWSGINAGRKETVQKQLPFICRLHSIGQEVARIFRAH